MPGSRGPMRAIVVVLALARWGVRRRAPEAPRRILVLHHLLLGDTLMVTGLLAKLRREHPAAEITMTVAPRFAPLFAGRPYGVRAQPFDPRDLATYWPLLAASRYDLVILPADNRYSWLARSLGARWIVGLAGDRPAHKNWPVDERIEYSAQPAAFCDTAASLARGPAPPPYVCADWAAPSANAVPHPAGSYAVLHVGASTPLKLWEPARWRALAAWLESQQHRAGVERRTWRGRAAGCNRRRPGAAALRRHAVAHPTLAPARTGVPAGVPGYRRWAPRTHCRRPHRCAVRTRFGDDLRRRRILRQQPLPCGNGRSLSLP